MKSIVKTFATTALFSALAMGSAIAEEVKELNFGIISTESSQNLKQLWEPFLEDMSEQTGYKVNAFFSSDYAGIIQGMRFDKVDVAWYGNKSAMEAVDRANGEVIFQTTNADGTKGYYSLLITHKDSPINSVEDMLANAGSLTFGNGDPNSTSGFLVPSYYVFAQNNVDPKQIFKRTLNANHEVNALSVANKQVDVATNNTEATVRLQAVNPEKASQIKEIWRSPLIPADPIVWRNNLPEDAKVKITAFFENYGDKPEEAQVLENLAWGKFEKSSNDQLIPIRQLELFKTRTQVANDSSLSEAEKAEKLKTVDDQLAALASQAKS